MSILDNYQQAMLDRGDCIAILWGIVDVISRAEDLEIDCSEAEARIILADVEHNHSGNLGVNWETFDRYLEEMDKERKEQT